MADKKFILGITGGSGVGKTTLINNLYQSFGEKITTLSLDNYYKPIEYQQLDENGVVNFDLPDALDTTQLKHDFEALINGQAITQKKYQFNNPDCEEQTTIISPKKIILVEGLFVMHYPFLSKKLDFSVYINVDPDLQLKRRLKRDVEERNINKEEVLYQWENHVIPAYENFILPHQHKVDMILNNNTQFDQKSMTDLLHVIETNLA